MIMEKTEDLRRQIAALVDEYAALAFAPKPFTPGSSIVPPSGKVIGAAELKNMVEASLDGWLTSGRFNDAFEQRLAQYLGVKHLITVNSGSSANLVAFSTLTSPMLGDRAIGPGDEIIGAQLFIVQGWPLGPAMTVAVLAGLAAGLLSAVLIVLVKLPPFIATLGVMGISRGLAFIITEGQYFDVSTMMPGGWRPPPAGPRRRTTCS